MKRPIKDFPPEKLKPSPELKEVQHIMPISKPDYDNLKADIKKSKEIRDPIKVYSSKGEFLILGGLNRCKIAIGLGIKLVPIEIYRLTASKRKELVINDNLNRRHLTREQKQQLIDYFLKKGPDKSNRAIAEETGTDHKTVKARRNKLESTGEIPQLKKTTGKDGRARTTAPEKKITGENPRLKKEAHAPLKNIQHGDFKFLGKKRMKKLIKDLVRDFIECSDNKKIAVIDLIAIIKDIESE